MSTIPSMPKKSSVVYDVLNDKDYPARITRFVGLGVQDQPEWNGQKKAPAFKAAFEFELIDIDATGRMVKNAGTDQEEITEFDPRPACMFQDYFLFPGAERGNVFNLCQAVDPSITSVPSDIQWFIDNLLNKIVNVRVGHYVVKRGPNAGAKRNKVDTVSAIPEMFKKQVGKARRDLVGFDPYVESDEMFTAYQNLFPYQRDILVEAHDSQNIVYAGKEVPKQDPATDKPKDPEVKSEGDDDKPF